MQARELEIAGAWEITPAVHPDSRGLFFEWLTDHSFTEFAGHRLDVRQANCSVSGAGVLRGLHFAQLPPSQAKYVTCLSGSVFDVVVDIRVGSPTFGRWDSVLLDDRAIPYDYLVLATGARHDYFGKDEWEATAPGLKKIDDAVADVEEAIRADPDRSASYASLGAMQMVRGNQSLRCLQGAASQ